MKAQVYYISAMLVFAQFGIGALWGELLPTPVLLFAGFFLIAVSLLQSFLINTFELIMIKYALAFSYFYYALMVPLQVFLYQYAQFQFINPYAMGSVIVMGAFAAIQFALFLSEMKSYHHHLDEDVNRSQKTFLMLPTLLVLNLYLYYPIDAMVVYVIALIIILLVSSISFIKDSSVALYTKQLKYVFALGFIVAVTFYSTVLTTPSFVFFLRYPVAYLHAFVMGPFTVLVLSFSWLYEHGKIRRQWLKPKHYTRTTLTDVQTRNIHDVLPKKRRRYR